VWTPGPLSRRAKMVATANVPQCCIPVVLRSRNTGTSAWDVAFLQDQDKVEFPTRGGGIWSRQTGFAIIHKWMEEEDGNRDPTYVFLGTGDAQDIDRRWTIRTNGRVEGGLSSIAGRRRCLRLRLYVPSRFGRTCGMPRRPHMDQGFVLCRKVPAMMVDKI
jgi:hypothetical protein